VQDRFYGYKHWTLEEVPRCFYVGKGLKRRPFSKSRRHRSRKWHAVVERYGLRVEVCVGPVSDELVREWEKEWIAKEGTFTKSYSHNVDINCNFTTGGDGVAGRVVSAYARERIGAAQRGKPKSQETKDKIRAALLGRKLSDATREKMSQARAGRPLSDQNRRNLWSNRKREHSPAHRKQLSLAAQDRCVSDETRAKMSAAQKGKQHRCSRCGEFGHLKPTCKVE